VSELRKAIRRYGRHMLALSGIVAIALAVAAYVTVHQRLRFPWQDEIQIYAEFESANAVTPGQGQTVDVAGVKIGDIGDVRLENGVAVVRMDITEQDEVGPIYRNATLVLRPKTGLNDMAIQMNPGSPDRSLPDDGRLRDGDRIPLASTEPNVNPDAVLAALDTDTRRYLQALLGSLGHGLHGRGPDLREVLKASRPALTNASPAARALADRRRQLKRLIHNLNRLAALAGSKDRELRSLVSAASEVVGTLGERDRELQGAVERLPGTLGVTRSALAEARGLAVEARPALETLRPLVRELKPSLVAARPLLRDATPVVRDGLRPLIREANPLLDSLRPSVAKIDRVTAPQLVDVGKVLNRTVNVLGYNPPGKEEGFLFHLDWYVHNASSILSIEDAHGVAWRGLVMFGCSTFPDAIAATPAFAPYAQLPLCPQQGKTAVPKGLSPNRLVRLSHVPAAERAGIPAADGAEAGGPAAGGGDR
jgi:phospholipid/cholesterol/gamma-HCH transport system substrate-binding protein